MNRTLRAGWAAPCLLIALGLCGCRHDQPCATVCETGAPVPLLPGGLPSFPAAGTTPTGLEGAALPAHDGQPVLPAPQPTPAGAAPQARALLAAAPAEAGAGHFGHDPQYHWLVGTLDYSRAEQAWLLHYLPVEQDDRYGGCVTLDDPGPMKGYQVGQVVRAEGELIDPESRQLRPAFTVKNLRAEAP